MAPKYAYWMTRRRSRRRQSKLAFVADRTSVCEDFIKSRIDLTCVLQQESICSILVVGSAALDRLQPDDACVMRK